MTNMIGVATFLSQLAAALSYLALGIFILARGQMNAVRLSIGIASFLTAAWAGGTLFVMHYGLHDAFRLSIQMETVRTAAWIFVLVLMQRRSWGLDDRPTSTFVVAMVLGFIVALQLALGLMVEPLKVGEPLGGRSVAFLLMGTRLAMAISGLVLLHNLYVNARERQDITFRLFAVGLGLICAYDLNMHTLHFLTGRPIMALVEIRGAVNVLAVPLFFVALERERSGSRFQPSRKAAFHTISFTIIGAYLIIMSLLSHALRLTGGDWGVLLQVVFVALALMVGAMAVLSPRLRAELKVRISRNFFRYRYDYRVEWLRFIDTIHASPDSLPEELPIRERLVKAVAVVLDCNAGALIEPSSVGGYEMATHWEWDGLEVPVIDDDSPLIQFMAATGRIVDFDRLRPDTNGHRQNRGYRPPDSHDMLPCPDWVLVNDNIWLAVPLIHNERLTGILLLHRSLAQRELNWEDFDLLRTLGRQGASYLAEAATQAELDAARSFDEFNRRFAFVMHDLKNIVSQLGLLARNAERHADNPEFRADMVQTLQLSVTKMTDLMQLLAREIANKEQGQVAELDGQAVDFAALVATMVATLRRGHGMIEFSPPARMVMVHGKADQLEAMVTHLIQNAIDASTSAAPIHVHLETNDGAARLIVEDQGSGMTSAFIRDGLFKPFHSTKEDGFGIGAFEAREIVVAHGGQMQVWSKPGIGTRFTILLPLNTHMETEIIDG